MYSALKPEDPFSHSHCIGLYTHTLRLYVTLKVVVRACYRAYFVAHVFAYLVPDFISGRPA